jgi:hypothetical protein
LTIIQSERGFLFGSATDIGHGSQDHSHNALVIGENPLGVANAEEPARQGARTLGSRKG